MKKIIVLAIAFSGCINLLGAQPEHYTTGKHVVADLWGATAIEDTTKIESMLRHAANLAGCKVVSSKVEKFAPQGLTGFAVLEESHLSIHTWPEYGYVAVDLYSCNDGNDGMSAIKYLVQQFDAKKHEIHTIRRGVGVQDTFNLSDHVQKAVGYQNVPFGDVADVSYDSNSVVEMEANPNRIFGQHVILTLEGCSLEKIATHKHLADYLVKLVDLIDMKAYGKPFIKRFAEHSEFAAGYSIGQMIETSLISGHFSEFWKTAYIDIFSCKPYDTKKAVNFTKEFFEATGVKVRVLIR